MQERPESALDKMKKKFSKQNLLIQDKSKAPEKDKTETSLKMMKKDVCQNKMNADTKITVKGPVIQPILNKKEIDEKKIMNDINKFNNFELIDKDNCASYLDHISTARKSSLGNNSLAINNSEIGINNNEKFENQLGFEKIINTNQ